MNLVPAKRSILTIGPLLLVSGALLFFLLSSQPLIKLLRFAVFNTFELEGDAVGLVERDLIYKSVAGEALMVDLYMPLVDEFKSAPVVVFSHGGGWVMGDRATLFIGPDNEQLIGQLRMRGYAIANFEYRLLSETATLADLVADNKDIVRWLRMNAGKFGLDPANIGYWGQSAGGHLVLMAGLSNDDEFIGDASLRDTSARVNYIVNNYGPTDLTEHFRTLITREEPPGFFENLQTENMFAVLFEVDRDAFVENLTALSPVSYVDPDDPPVLTLHGESDTLVSPNQSRLLTRALGDAGADHETHFIADADHIFNGATADQIAEIVELTAAFIARHTHGRTLAP